MKILALDDSEAVLMILVEAIREACPSASVSAFTEASELLSFAEENICDVAFLDIEMWGISGLSVAKSLKDINPKTNIIFVTAHEKYMGDAYAIYPSGYVLKPVTKEAIERELNNLRHPIAKKCDSRIYVQTFGSFEIFVDTVPLKFKHSKTKELLAYLVDRRGAVTNTNELCGILWEDNEQSLNVKAYFRKLVCDLTETLKKAGADCIFYKQRNCFAVLPDKFKCDVYEYGKYDTNYVNSYLGEYMAQYSWAEMTSKVLSYRIYK